LAQTKLVRRQIRIAPNEIQIRPRAQRAFSEGQGGIPLRLAVSLEPHASRPQPGDFNRQLQNTLAASMDYGYEC